MKRKVFKALLPATIILTIFSAPIYSQEICTNALDDDGDGLIDMNDPDCDCIPISPGSIIPNASFEDMVCCPDGTADLDCADTWIQASDATSEYFNSCDYMTTAVPQPMPDGEACVGALVCGGWQEYVGACLLEPLVANEPYLLKMDISSCRVSISKNYLSDNNLGPLELTVFGSPNCSDLPFDGSDCPLNAPLGDWYELGSITYDPLHAWVEYTFELTANIDINAIAIGSPCILPPGYEATSPSNGPYVLFDNLILNEQAAFGMDLTSEYVLYQDNGDELELDQSILTNNPAYGQFCFDQMELEANALYAGQIQWYQNEIAIIGETDTTMQVSFAEYSAGNYGVGLFVNDSVCLYSTIDTHLPLYPVAEMQVDEICIPDMGNLVSVPDGFTTISEYKWLVDDQYEYDAATANHLFEGHNIFNVKHWVQAENFCQDSTESTIEMPAIPEIDFYFENICANETVQFFDSSTVDYGAVINSWDWVLPPGINSSSAQNPSFALSDFGTYTITLEATSDEGCSNSFSQELIVHPTPDAQFDLSPICFSDPLAFFDNQSSIAQGTMSFHWTFGDGGSSQDEDPMHLFQDPGVFDVQVLATSDFGCVDSVLYGQIVSQVIANFDYGFNAGCHPHSINLNSTSISTEGTLDQFRWIYSSGDTIYSADDVPTFTNYGHEDNMHYDISLMVIDEYGCADSIQQNQLVEVWPRPLAQFNYTIDESNEQFQLIQFNNTTIGGKYFDWSLGNGTYSDDVHPFSYYKDSDTYYIELLAETTYGCLDTAMSVIEIDPANYVYVPNAFTPNADGLNDLISPSILGDVLTYQFEVYDRWGQVLFSSQKVGEGWNGSYLEKDSHYVMSGNYPFRLTVQFIGDAEADNYTGMVTLIR